MVMGGVSEARNAQIFQNVNSSGVPSSHAVHAARYRYRVFPAVGDVVRTKVWEFCLLQAWGSRI